MILLLAGIAAAQAGPTLPLYWLTGRVVRSDAPFTGVADMPVVFYRDDGAMATARTDANGYYRLNVFTLKYMFGVPVTVEAGYTYYTGVPQQADSYGTGEAIVLDPGIGFLINDLVMVPGGNIVTDKSLLMGKVQSTVGPTNIIGAKVTVTRDGAAIASTESTDGGYVVAFDPGPFGATCAHASYGTLPMVPDNAATEKGTWTYDFYYSGPLGGLSINTTDPLPPGYVSFPYFTALQATGGLGGYAWSLTDGALPAGLTLASDGTISGTPAEIGTANFTVRVTDGANMASKSLSLAVTKLEPKAGTVPLTISRSGNDIVLTWEAKYADPNIYIQAISDPLAGEYTNSYNATKWVLSAPYALGPGSYSYDPANNRFTHYNQNKAGVAEVYYKAVTAEIDVTNPLNAPTFEGAWVAGKVNVQLYNGWNLVGSPFGPGSANSILGLGTDYQANEAVWTWNDSLNQFVTDIAQFSGGAWPVGLNLMTNRGYWLYLLDNGVAGGLRTRTLIGTYYPPMYFTRQIYTAWNLVGNPLPVRSGAAFSGTANDKVWIWSNQNQNFSELKDYNASDLKLLPGKGYWYYHLGSGFTWNPGH